MPSGSVSLANSRLSLVNGTAFVDFSAAGTLTPYLNGKLTLTDSAGKKAIGYIKAAGTGETLGAELVTNGTFTTDTTGWTNRASYEWDTFEVSASKLHLVGNGDGTPSAYYSYSDDNIALVVGALIKKSYVIDTVTVGSVFTCLRQAGTSGSAYASDGKKDAAGTYTYYYCPTVSENVTFQIYQPYGTATDMLIDNASVKQVLTPSATGVTITSTRGGTTYNWASIESGFNYNDSAGYTYTIALAKRSFNFGFGWDFS